MCSDRATHKLNTSHLHIGIGKRIVMFSFAFFHSLLYLSADLVDFPVVTLFAAADVNQRELRMLIRANCIRLIHAYGVHYEFFFLNSSHAHSQTLALSHSKHQAGFDSIHFIFTHVAEVITLFSLSWSMFCSQCSELVKSSIYRNNS